MCKANNFTEVRKDPYVAFLFLYNAQTSDIIMGAGFNQYLVISWSVEQ